MKQCSPYMQLIKANKIFLFILISAVIGLVKCRNGSNTSTANSAVGTVVFVRHGESEWNTLNVHTGWFDTMLTERGKKQAKAAGDCMNKKRIPFDFVHTSLLTRAIQTTEIMLREMSGLFKGPINTTWLLNERHKGALTGVSKSETNWTSHWTNRPPPLLPGHPYYTQIQENPRYKNVGKDLPNTESSVDAQKRFIRYWLTTIAPQVQDGGRILVVAHGDFFRGVVQYFDQIPNEVAISLRFANAKSFEYKFDEYLNPLNKFNHLHSNSMN